jgi:hypothetical protein
MEPSKRPLSVTIIGWVYIAVGAIGFVSHGIEFFGRRTGFESDIVWIELTELLALVCGAFILRGQNWARWAALAWMGFHVILSAFHAWSEFAIHCLFFGVIAWVLLRPEAARYFRPPRDGT